MEGYQQGVGGENGGRGIGSKKHNWQAQNRQGEVKNSIGNGEAKDPICMTLGCKEWGGNTDGNGGTGQRGLKERKRMGQLQQHNQ